MKKVVSLILVVLFASVVSGCASMTSPSDNSSVSRDPSAEAIISANQLRTQGDSEGAITLLNKALLEDRSYAELYIARGLAYTHQKLNDKALSDFNSAITINPNNPMAYMLRGAIYGEKGMYDLSISDLTKALNFKPEDLSSVIARGFPNMVSKREYDLKILEVRGEVYLHARNYDRAIADFTGAMVGNSDVKSLEKNYYNRGRAYFNSGEEALRKENTELAVSRYSLAVKDVEEALKRNPSSAQALSFRQDIYSFRAEVYFKRKEYDKSWADVQQAISLGHKFDSASERNFLGDLRKASGARE